MCINDISLPNMATLPELIKRVAIEKAKLIVFTLQIEKRRRLGFFNPTGLSQLNDFEWIYRLIEDAETH